MEAGRAVGEIFALSSLLFRLISLLFIPPPRPGQRVATLRLGLRMETSKHLAETAWAHKRHRLQN